MNAVMTSPTYEGSCDHVRTGSLPEVLAEIFVDDVNLVLWNRQLSDMTSAYARQQQCVISLSLQTTGNCADLQQFLERYLPSGSFGASPSRGRYSVPAERGTLGG